MSLWDDIRSTAGEQIAKAAQWAAETDDDVSPDQMNNALDQAGMGLPDPTEEKPRAMFHDPYSVMDWGGWRQRPSALTYETLRQMSVSNTVIASILNLRTHQVSAFCRPQQGKYDKGYRIIQRNRRDKRKAMSPGEQTEAEAIERFLEETGILLPGEKPCDRDSFRSFNKKAVRDVLTYDQWTFEKQRDRLGRPSRFIALPSETIRPAVSDIEHMDPTEMRSRVSHVQVYENTVIAEFANDDIAWCIMNPRSDLRTNTFGFSPIEQIVRLVTAWLFGFEYNTKFFTQGSAIKGLLNIKGAIPDRQMRAFRRMWYTMIAGVSNSWKTPILNAEDIQWHSMHSTNREMEYGQWMDWLTKLICAVYGVDPVEINFIFGNSGQTSSLSQTRPNESEVTESKDKGLLPLLTHIEDHINSHMIWELNPEFEFSFTGYDAKAEATERASRIEEVKGLKTLDEVRAEMDEEPMPDGLGEVILDPVYLQWAMSKQQEAMGMPPGAEAPPGAAGGPMPGEGGFEPTESDDSGDDEEELIGPSTQLDDGDDDEHGDLLAASVAARERNKDPLRKGRRDLDIWLPGGE